MTAPGLARRLVEHPRWPGFPVGMPLSDGDLYIRRRGDVTHFVYQLDEDADNGVGDINWYRDPLPDLDSPATKGWLLHWLDESCVTLMLLRGGLIFVEWDDASGVRHRDAFDNLASALLAVWGEP